MIVNGKTKIVSILGKSGSGKTSITTELKRQGYKSVISHTDRPMRKEEIDNPEACDHIFVDTETIKRMIDNKKIVVCTYYNNNTYYGASLTEIQNSAIYIIDEHGYKELIETFGKENVVSILITAKADVRFKRIKERSGDKEALERLEHDRTVFANFKPDYVVENNGELDVAVKEVKKIIDELYKEVI